MSLLGDLGTAIKNKLGGTSVDNTVPRYNGTTCTLQISGVTISDTNVVTASGGFVGNLTGNASTATSATTSASTTGNAATATKLQTARSIALAGDVTGSATFDGSANISITATVVDDSHNHTIGNIDSLQTSLNAKANLASPALTGTPTAPTAAAGTNTTQIATTAFVQAQKANIALTGTPTAPTAAAGTNTTQIATTAFVLANRRPLSDSVSTTSSTTAATSTAVKSAYDRATTALNTANAVVTTTSVGTATAGLAVGSVGSYAFMEYIYSTTLEAGATLAGSGLRYSCVSGAIKGSGSTVPSGTWRAMGRAIDGYLTLFLRIS